MTTLIGGFAVWGGIGWLLDLWLGTRLFTPIGLIVGMALGIYAVVARFGLAAAPPPTKPQQQSPRVPPTSVGAREENE
ncbi:AtpZ/AtpI family protein [Nakamurella deserti]|uniref:AtpZ/AtpI family protein n=1 Tax=Nakamurella deserti TaxID=2164074 RepID=UPI00197C71E8|nr:AtpZ/AtpI family protein [Nakamurella deserti]